MKIEILIISQVEDNGSSSESKSQGNADPSQPEVKTAHSLSKEGSFDCIFLSRRGLFTAGTVSNKQQ